MRLVTRDVGGDAAHFPEEGCGLREFPEEGCGLRELCRRGHQAFGIFRIG
jgi:hypothetical protein